MYKKYIKRILDFILSLLALIVLSPLLLVLTILGAINMKGNPFFTQDRPGLINKETGKETIFKLIKFRSMTNEKDKDGNLLPDEKRLTSYGKFLRSSSLDELPSLINIIKGDMSIVGPRPQLVRDLVFMSDDTRLRHTVRPGLTGLAQVNGRNNITWEDKFKYDLEYIKDIRISKDIKIILKTIVQVIKADGINSEGLSTAQDYGDYLLASNKITEEEYSRKVQKA